MNFLDLAKRTRQELGVSGVGPAAVQGQSGHQKKIVDWVQDAYNEVQETLNRQNPAIMWGEVPLADGKDAYDPDSEWGLKIKRLSPDGLFVQPLGEPLRRAPLREVNWTWMRAQAPAGGIPVAYSVRPDRAIVLWPIPPAGYELCVEYESEPQVLEANGDTPRIPERYHMAIVWRAVMFGCAHDEDLPLFQASKANYVEIMGRVAREELPAMEVYSLL